MALISSKSPAYQIAVDFGKEKKTHFSKGEGRDFVLKHDLNRTSKEPCELSLPMSRKL